MFFGGFPGFDDGSARRSSKKVDTNKFYEVLGVDKNATTADIKKVWAHLLL